MRARLRGNISHIRGALLGALITIALATSTGCGQADAPKTTLNNISSHAVPHLELTAAPLAYNLAGGSFTIASRGRQSLQRPQPKLSAEQQLEWAVGKSFATQAWVSAPATTTARDGLGPLFNANSCSSCHIRNGQGRLPENGLGLILRLGTQFPTFGEQLQDMANPGSEPEGRVTWRDITQDIVLPDGSEYALTKRNYAVDGSQKTTSARLAPALIGMGLLAAIKTDDIIANSDPTDINRDGISGAVNYIVRGNGDLPAPGRFGWKASQESLIAQVALAFFEDMGITSSRHPPLACPKNDCSEPSNTAMEISDKLLNAVTDYIANLAVPAAAHDELSLQGKTIFNHIGCAACHIPSFNIEVPASPFAAVDGGGNTQEINVITETIYPYSDLLLHDMGPNLADQYSSDGTAAAEWRTAPLWGLGIRAENSDNARLLHDGRGRSIAEAILWHGGEAAASKSRFTQLSESEHAALLHFLKAL
ncbi:di-heme oxidoredictase family protein [Zhongshania sp.]|uniref:di-heme oxidoredictase family protein n=1 Tax=Zhongshania sp. TaxID=1971902 RepID=UPI001B4636B0|nr:di-heme oxidoredictase family protein [Zhongshania sp.]MBQ0797183.1 hypothetical protein [Zhongshania sp.]